MNNEMKAKDSPRTPGSWKAEEGIEANYIFDTSGDVNPIAEVERLSDAEFIIQACNAHDSLVRTLRNLLIWTRLNAPISMEQVEANTTLLALDIDISSALADAGEEV